MAEDIEEPQVSEDPFAKYGGKAIEKSEDPFAKYGGKSIGTQSKTEQVGGLTAYSDLRQKTTPTEEIKRPAKLTDYTNVPLEMVSKAKATEVSRKPSTQPVRKIATEEKAAAEGTSTNLQLPTTLKGGQFGIVAEPQQEGELQQKLQQREEDKQTAIKNSLLSQGIKPNTQQYLQKEKDLNNQLSNDDLVVDKDNSGEPKLFRSQGFGETLAKTIYNSFKAPIDAYDVNKISDPNQFVQKMNEQTEEESSKPSKILGGGAELIGGVVKPISLLALNAVAGGMGTTAMVSEAYYSALANEKRRLYIAGKQQGLSDVDAAKKAMDAATYTALPDAAMAFVMSGELENLPKTVPTVADNTFKNALIKSGKSVLKVSALGGASEVGKIGTELLGGYKETLPNAIGRVWGSTTEWGKMDLGFKIIGGIVPAAGYLKAAAKNWLKNVPEELIQLKSEQYGDAGEKIKQSIEDYKNAASNVEGYVPDEHLASFAGKIEKANKLQDDITQKQLDKIGKPEFVQNKIDEEISDIQNQIDGINKEVNTAAKKGIEPKEIDDATGIEAGIEPKINVESTYNERKNSIDDKLNQQLEDNKNNLDDISEKGGTQTIRQKIYKEHSNEMIELEKWNMKNELNKEENDKKQTTQVQQPTENKELVEAIPTIEPTDNIKVGEMLDKTGTYKGVKGSFTQEGQTIIFKEEGKDKVYEIGNIDEVKDMPISDFDIKHEESIVSVDNDGNFNVRNEVFVNPFEQRGQNPTDAILYDKDGNVVNVRMKTADGKRRTFKGNIAEDLAYQIHLKEINKNNETRAAFEQHINEDTEAQNEINNAGLPKTTEGGTIEGTEQVPQQEVVQPKAKVVKVKVKPIEVVSETAPKEEKTAADTVHDDLLTHLGITEEPKGETKGEILSAEDTLKNIETKGVKASDETSLQVIKEKNKDNPLKTKIIEQATKASKALKSIFPNMEIHLHENDAEHDYVNEQVGNPKGTVGSFSFIKNEDGTYTGRIDINLNKANGRTIAHEVTHAILEKTFGENKELFKSFREKISSILTDETNDRLSSFSDNEHYASTDMTHEEYLAELSAALSDTKAKINPSTLEKVASVINKFVSKLTGGKFKPFEDIKNTKDVVDFFNKVSESIREGQDLSNISKDYEGKLYEQQNLNVTGKLEKELPPTGRKPKAKAAIKEGVDVEDHPIIDKNSMKGKRYSVTMSDHTKVGEYNNPKTGVKVSNLMGGVFYPYIKGIKDAGIGWASVTVKAAREMIQNASGQDATLVYRMSRSTGSRGNHNFKEAAFSELIKPVTDGKITEKEFLKQLNDKLNTVSGGKQLVSGKYFLGKHGTDTNEKLNVGVFNEKGKRVEGETQDITKKEITSIKQLKSALDKESFSKRGAFWSTLMKDSWSKKSTGNWYKFLDKNSVASLEDIANHLAEPEVDNAADHDIVAAVKIAEPEYITDKKGKKIIKIYTTRKDLVNEEKGVFFVDAPNHSSYPYVVKGEPIGIFNEFNHISDYFPAIGKDAEFHKLKNNPYKAVETKGKDLVRTLEPKDVNLTESGRNPKEIKSKAQLPKEEVKPTEVKGSVGVGGEVKIFTDSNNPKVEISAIKSDVNNLFESIKNDKFSSIKATFDEIVKDWDNYKNVDNDNIRTIKYFIENPIETAIITDGKSIEDGNHRLIASKIKGDKFIYTVPKSKTVFGDMDLIPKSLKETTKEEVKPTEKLGISNKQQLSKGDQDSKIKDFIEIQRQKGISDKDIQAGLEKASEKIGIDKAKIDELMSTPKVEQTGDLQSQYDGIKSEKAKKKFITKNFGEVSDEQLSDIVKNNTDLQTIKDKIDAIQKSGAGEILQRKQEGNGSKGGKRGGMEQGEQGAEATTKKNGEENGDGQRVGISHKSLTELADKLGLEQPERGDVLTPEEYSERGKLLIKNGADPIKAAEEFKKDNKVNSDIISVARAHFNELVRDVNDARIKFGIDSEEYKKSLKEANDWAKNVVKPMGTAFYEIGSSLQGQVDLDTGNFVSVSMAVQEKTGKDLSTEQTKEVERLTTNVSDLNKKIQDLEKKLTDTISKGEEAKPKAKEGIKEKSKEIANVIRKGKLSKPDIFSSASPASLVWDAAIEITAKTVEVSGDIAQAIADGLEHIKNSDWYKNSDSDKQKAAQKAFRDFVQNQDIKIRFAEKKDNKFTTEEAKSIWEYAKEEYLDKGSDYREMLNGVSKDLGLNRDQVRTAISQPKGAKEITDEMYRNINKRNSAINEAKQWVEEQGNSKTKNFLKAVPSAFFKLKTFGHGTVGGITHAGTNIFQISKWKSYFPFFAKQFKYAFGDTAKYEMAMEDLKNDPQFTFWQRAGLAVDPKVKYDDYQGNFVDGDKKVNGIKKFFDRLGVAGDRGFNALKVYRLDLAKGFYDRLSNEEKADPNTAKEIAKLVNHSTGTSELDLGRGGVSKFVSTAFFAPKLEASRWQGLIGDPAKAAKTFTNWKEASPAEKAGAKLVARNAGEKIATYVALLAANSALLSLMGSKQKINYTNPLSSDWLKFKTGGGKTLDITGGTLASMKLLGTLLDNTVTGYTGNKKELWKKPAEKDYQAIGTQIRYKLSPFASTIADLVETTDAMGRPLPYSNIKPKKGETQYTVGSYLLQQQTPIPISAGIREAIGSMKERGMTNIQIQDALMGTLYFTVEGFTGAKLGNEPKKKK